jgi:hypothetical protein
VRLLAAPLLALAVALPIAGCGGDDDDDLIEEGALHECMVDAGLSAKPPPNADAGALFVGVAAPDFVLYRPDGTSVAVIVEGTEAKAEQVAADLKGASASLGPAGPDAVGQSKNVVISFRAPGADSDPEQTQAIVEGCVS